MNAVNSFTTSTNSEDYHTELRILFLRLGLTQRDLARKLKISPEYLNRVLRGKRAGHALRSRLVLDFGFPLWLLDSEAARKAA